MVMNMKKLLLISLCFLLIGCGNKEKEKVTIEYDNSYYSIASPYKNASSNYTLASYDKKEVEIGLMNLSMRYFKTNNSLYQEGQYLTNEEIKQLLDKDHLNKIEDMTIDNVTINPTFIKTVYEQNYLATNNVLKGISLAIVVDNKQSYEQDDKKLYKMFEEEKAINFAKKKAEELLVFMRNKEGLKDIPIMIGIYLESNTSLKGGYSLLGMANPNLKWQNIDGHYEMMDSNTVMNYDVKNYNNVLAIKNSLKDNNQIYISSIGYYQEKELQSLQITITSNYFLQSQILDISKTITDNLQNFDSDISIKVYFKTNEIKAFLDKKPNVTKIETYILEG